MIAVDTNLLVYAHREESPFHVAAKSSLERLADSGLTWGLPWPCVHEFLAVVTNPRLFKTPIPVALALQKMEYFKNCFTLHFLGETESYWLRFKQILIESKMVGPQVHDARIAAICLENGVRTLWTADRDFSRIAGLKLVNPLIKKDVFFA
jgi:toxin-antitoxin system PIN domain toxin